MTTGISASFRDILRPADVLLVYVDPLALGLLFAFFLLLFELEVFGVLLGGRLTVLSLLVLVRLHKRLNKAAIRII